MTCYKGELTVFYLGILNETWDPDYDCDDLTEAKWIGDQEVLHVYGEEMEIGHRSRATRSIFGRGRRKCMHHDVS
jgi:predicted NodU family carbamoyl transferase